MSYINKYLRNFTPYKVASHRVWGVKPELRPEILKLDWNEATISPSPKVKERIKKLLEHDNFYNLYPSTINENLLELLSQYTQIPTNCIQYFASSDSLHEYIAKLFISVGDPVLIVWPSYDNFRLTAEVNGARVSFFEYDENFLFCEEKFETEIEKINPSLIYICNPNNPTGNRFSTDYIHHLISKYTGIIFLIDEAYSEFSGESAKDLVNSHENILISRTMSKAFALANFRFGYLLSSPKNIQYISSIRNPKNITTFAQEAATAALLDIEYMQKYVKEVNTTKDYFFKEISLLSPFFRPFPSFGNFILIRCSNMQLKLDLLKYLEERNIFIRNVSQSNSLSMCVRISIGLKEQMEIVVNAFQEFLKTVK
jgi:histidinol-phosphate aminotransferase